MLCLSLNIVKAQQTATTSTGKVVILFENGTWKYAEDIKKEEEVKKSIPEKPFEILEAKVEKKEFLMGPSKKLSKYFKTRNIVKCDLILDSNKDGVSLITEWKVMTGEAYSYFGYIKKGAFLSLQLISGETIDLVFDKEYEPKEFEKYGFSTYSAAINLTKSQISKLRNNIIIKATMNWSRRAESYKIASPDYFKNNLQQITKDK